MGNFSELFWPLPFYFYYYIIINFFSMSHTVFPVLYFFRFLFVVFTSKWIDFTEKVSPLLNAALTGRLWAKVKMLLLQRFCSLVRLTYLSKIILWRNPSVWLASSGERSKPYRTFKIPFRNWASVAVASRQRGTHTGGRGMNPAHSSVHSKAVGFGPLCPWCSRVSQRINRECWHSSGVGIKTKEKNPPLYLRVMSCGHDAKASMD